MRKWTFIFILFLLFCPFTAAEDIDWERIGTIKPRHARDIQSSNFSVGAETMDRDYTIYKNWKDYLGPLGVKKARIQGGWAKTEKRKGVYDFNWLDEIIFDMNDQGVEPWVCLCYGNGLYADGGGVRLGAQIPKSEDALRAWTQWVRAFVSRYMDVIDEWEIWNEPNLRRSNAARDYARFMLHTAGQIRKIQPEAKIIAMSTAGVDTKFIRDVLDIAKRQNKLDLIDQITYHPYTKNPDTSYPAVEKLRRTVREFSPRITLRQGENGCPSMRRKTKALRGYDWTEVSQAKWALRRLLGDLGRDIESSYFAIMDMKYPDEMNAKGLLKSRDDQTVAYAKPAYHAVQNLASIFDSHLYRVKDFECTAETTQSVSAFAYKNVKTGFHVVTIWLDGEVPSDNTAKTKVDFVCSALKIKSPVYVDFRDGIIFAIPKEHVRFQDKKSALTEIPIYDSPIVITDLANLHINANSAKQHENPGGLILTALGKSYSPDPRRVPIHQSRANMGGSTSVRNVDADHLTWKHQGYYQRSRDLGQVFTPETDLRLDAVVLRTGPSDNVVKAGAPGSKMFIQFFEVVGTPRINDNGTPQGRKALHGFSTNHRCDDFIEGIRYKPLRLIKGGIFPNIPPTRDMNGNLVNGDAGKLMYVRWDLLGADEIVCKAGRRYAFMVGFEKPGPERAFTLANDNAASSGAVPSLTDATDAYHGGWGLRREGDGSLPPQMISGENAPQDARVRRNLVEDSLFAIGPARYVLSPTTDGYPDVVDEEEAFRRVGDADLEAQLLSQDAAMNGRKGSMLWAVSATDGQKLTEYRMDSLPVFDGMAADGCIW